MADSRLLANTVSYIHQQRQSSSEKMTSWQQDILDRSDPELRQALTRYLTTILDPAHQHPGLVDQYYLPVFFYLYEQTLRHGQPGFIAGINAPQGGGKSTLTSYLVRLFKQAGLRAVTVSIDDFYLTRAGQIQLANEHPDNPYLQQRGYPGTHDIALGVKILTNLKQPGNQREIALPRYEKSRHNGQGDRAESSIWPRVDLPVDVILFEGWMLGFQPIPDTQQHDTHLLHINSLLEPYTAWHRLLDSFLYLYPEDPVYVVDWRSEAEERMKAKGLPGMSAAEVRAYAEKFLPAYQLYGKPLLNHPPVQDNFLAVRIGRNRLPV